MSEVFRIGDYRVIKGSLSEDDARGKAGGAYVTKTFPDGARRPFASCWNVPDAIARAKESHARDEAEAK